MTWKVEFAIEKWKDKITWKRAFLLVTGKIQLHMLKVDLLVL
jgi:hypothetical protein